MKLNKELLKQKEVEVRCNTKFEALDLCNLLADSGYRWDNGSYLLENSYWKEGTDAVYSIGDNKRVYCDCYGEDEERDCMSFKDIVIMDDCIMCEFLNKAEDLSLHSSEGAVTYNQRVNYCVECGKPIEEIKEMTQEQIEDALGYKIKIIS